MARAMATLDAAEAPKPLKPGNVPPIQMSSGVLGSNSWLLASALWIRFAVAFFLRRILWRFCGRLLRLSLLRLF